VILPADWFFAKPNEIIDAAQEKELPDFWPTSDWVKQDGTGALAGYGVSQLMSGELLGERINEYWVDKPDYPKDDKEKWPKAEDDVIWMASVSAANARKVLLGKKKGLVKI